MSFRTIGVLGLARSGRAAVELALAKGIGVYAADAADTEELRAGVGELSQRGAEVELGRINIDKLLNVDALVVSPGIPPQAPPLNDPRLARVQRISEIEFASRFLKARIIAITGTNGKSTTTALAGHLLEAGGISSAVAGNIGNALSNVALLEQQPSWVVVEVSSFQLADIDRFAPVIGAVTNLAPDHLDRYQSVEQYYRDKQNIFRHSGIDKIWVLNGDDPAVLELAKDAAGRRLLFKTSGQLVEGEHGAYVSPEGDLMLKVDLLRAKLVHTSELQLIGKHNHANALAAVLIAIGTGVPIPALREGLRSFKGLPHRLQVVHRAGGVTWIDDSKATNVASASVALQSMTGPTILLLGGRHKGEPYSELLPYMFNIKGVLAYGEAAPLIMQGLEGRVPVEHVPGTLEKVVQRAAAIAQDGDVVLLAPACSSFDMFRNYEERGDTVAQLARQVNHG
ncbi:MAG TPA: UDP-N-acetylmuramoyl-L-alanine--D-glutamate ligase [Longimicrobiales bacterium]|nr:UDP-N-acetylmuramoyl-L-alanine--D-glutamate ligase [Longimicrobiales bacterium]